MPFGLELFCLLLLQHPGDDSSNGGIPAFAAADADTAAMSEWSRHRPAGLEAPVDAYPQGDS